MKRITFLALCFAIGFVIGAAGCAVLGCTALARFWVSR